MSLWQSWRFCLRPKGHVRRILACDRNRCEFRAGRGNRCEFRAKQREISEIDASFERDLDKIYACDAKWRSKPPSISESGCLLRDLPGLAARNSHLFPWVSSLPTTDSSCRKIGTYKKAGGAPIQFHRLVPTGLAGCSSSRARRLFQGQRQKKK